MSLVPISRDLRTLRPIGHAGRVTFLDGVVGRVGHAAEWVTEAADQLARRYPADDVVVSAAVGWMRLGPQGAPIVDTVFVVTPEVLLFVGNDEGIEPARVLLSDVVGLDLLEGLPLPLDAIEIRVVGDLAVLVGWPQDFRDAVLSVLTGGWPPAAPPAAVAVTPPDELDTTAEGVPVVDPDEPSGPVEALLADADDEQHGRGDGGDAEVPRPPALPTAGAPPGVEPIAEPVAEPAAEPAAELPLIAGRATPPPLDASADTTFGAEAQPAPVRGSASAQMDDALDLVLGELPEQLQHALGDEWPAPIRHVTVLGGTADRAKRRKHVTLHIDADGLRLTTSGFGSWTWELAPTDITAIDVAGVDEVMYTHSLRIGSDSAALFVTQPGGDQVILEVPGTDPHQLRVELGACLLRWGRANGPDTVTYF